MDPLWVDLTPTDEEVFRCLDNAGEEDGGDDDEADDDEVRDWMRQFIALDLRWKHEAKLLVLWMDRIHKTMSEWYLKAAHELGRLSTVSSFRAVLSATPPNNAQAAAVFPAATAAASATANCTTTSRGAREAAAEAPARAPTATAPPATAPAAPAVEPAAGYVDG
jgi:hypothetical protein